MSRMLLPILTGILALGLCAQDPRTLRPQQAPAQPAEKEARIALVIGNGAYKEAPLRNPPSDAKAMAQALQACGFQVSLLVDADRATMFRAVREFGERIHGGGVGLFYYAGHGMAVRGTNFLIPVGVDIATEDEVPVQALDVNAVLGKMDAARNRLNILILDACRNNPFARSFRSASRGLFQMEAPSGSFVAFATAPGSTASDGEGQNGLYTHHILQALQQPGLNVEQVFKQVRIGVKRDSRDQQIPWDSSSLTGDFYFRPAGSPLPATPAPFLSASTPRTRSVGEWMTWQADMDQAMAQLKATLARKDATPAAKLAALEEARRDWTEDNPYTDKDDQARQWLHEQEVNLRLWQSATLAVQARGSLNPSGYQAWRHEEHHRLAAMLKGVPRGETYLKWLQDGRGDVASLFHVPGEKDRDAVSKIQLVWVPPGSFEMGSNGSEGDEAPAHAVSLSRGFWLGQFPVTQGQWQEVMGNNPAAMKTSGLNAPVESVSWEDVQQFLTTLNGMQDAWTFRLPTEAEWEYACRAGTTGDRYGDIDAIAWYAHWGGNLRTQAVGQKQANAFGLHDMNGNVWEWCQDWYDEGFYQQPEATQDPSGPATGQFRVNRGGSFASRPKEIRSAYRGFNRPDARGNTLGFRVAATPRSRL